MPNKNKNKICRILLIISALVVSLAGSIAYIRGYVSFAQMQILSAHPYNQWTALKLGTIEIHEFLKQGPVEGDLIGERYVIDSKTRQILYAESGYFYSDDPSDWYEYRSKLALNIGNRLFIYTKARGVEKIDLNYTSKYDPSQYFWRDVYSVAE